jgi:hypothetical protein
MNSGLMTFFENLVNKAAEYVKIPVSETMEVERMKVNALAIELTNTNTPLQRRNEIYEDLKSLAPDIVAGIDAENISVEVLRGNLAKYNNEMIKKIAIQQSQETLSDKQKDLGKITLERAESEIELMEHLVKIKDNIAKKDFDAGKRAEEILISTKDLLEKEKELAALGREINPIQETTSILQSGQVISGQKVVNLRSQELRLQEEMNQALKNYTDLYNKIFGTSEGFIGPPDAAYLHQPSGAGGGLGKGDKSKKDKKSFNPKQIGSEEIQSIIDLNKQKQEAYKEGREQIIIDLQEAYQKEANIRQIAHNEEMAALGTDEEARKALDQQFKKDEALRLAAHLQVLVKQTEDILATGGIEGLNIEAAMLTDEEKEALLAKIEELKVKISELNAEASGINLDGEKKDPLGMTEDDWDKLMEHVQNAATIAQQLGDIWNSINQKIANQENANLANYEKNTDKRKKALEDQLKKGLISQKKYDESVTILDENLDKEKRKLEAEQAKRARTAAIFNILINGAMATINALNTQPFVLGLVMAALAVAATAAAIASLPPVPAYAEGGFTSGDKVYRAGEKGKEWIAPNWMTEHPYISPVIRDLEDIRSGRSPESVFRLPVVPEYDTTRSSTMTNNYYQTSTSEGSKFDKLIEQNEQLLKYLTDPKNRRAIIVHDDLSRYEDEISLLQELGRI